MVPLKLKRTEQRNDKVSCKKAGPLDHRVLDYWATVSLCKLILLFDGVNERREKICSEEHFHHFLLQLRMPKLIHSRWRSRADF